MIVVVVVLLPLYYDSDYKLATTATFFLSLRCTHVAQSLRLSVHVIQMRVSHFFARCTRLPLNCKPAVIRKPPRNPKLQFMQSFINHLKRTNAKCFTSGPGRLQFCNSFLIFHRRSCAKSSRLSVHNDLWSFKYCRRCTNRSVGRDQCILPVHCTVMRTCLR